VQIRDVSAGDLVGQTNTIVYYVKEDRPIAVKIKEIVDSIQGRYVELTVPELPTVPEDKNNRFQYVIRLK
jgi:hypothetical protein